MKKILSIVAAAVCAAQAGYCSASTLQGLKLLANTESVSVTRVAGPELLDAFPKAATYSDIVQDGVTLPYYLMASRPPYTAQEAGVDSGYPVLLSHEVIPDKKSLLKAVSFWNALLEKAGVKLYGLSTRGAQSGYILEILYIGEPVIKSYDSSSAGLVYETAAGSGKGMGEAASKIEAAGGKVLAKFNVKRENKYSFAVYFSGGAAGKDASKTVDLVEAAGALAAIVEGAHQVGAAISGLASYASNTESNKTDYKGKFMSGGKAVNSMISAAERRSTVVGLQIYSNQKPEGRVYSYLVYWKGAGF